MSSIIDDIHDVERVVDEIKASGRREIQKIYEAQTKKIAEMQSYFAEEFTKESAALEVEMAARVAAYEEELKTSFPDGSAFLKKILEEKKEELVNLLLREFWRK